MRSVILTGVSQGLGAALFDEFHVAGDRILAIGRRFTDDQRAAAEATPDLIRLQRADLADTAALPLAEVATFATEAAGHELVLIHNAAVVDPLGAIGTLAADDIQRAVAVNLTAPMVLTNAVLATDAVQGTDAVLATDAVLGTDAVGTDAVLATKVSGVTVLFVSSGAARMEIGGMAVYSATKRGGEVFIELLAAQHADDRRVRAEIVQPGTVDTPMQERTREVARSDAYFPMRDFFLGLPGSERLRSPADVARTIIMTLEGRAS